MANDNTSGRVVSIDALRGFDMFFIMGLAGLITSICALFPDGDKSWLATQMTHVTWDGLRHHDTIFPLFLFITGLSFPFSYSKSVSKGMTRSQITKKAIIRGLVLFFFGLVYNGFFNLKFSSLRWMSVLGRIGLSWMIAAILYIYCKRNTRIWICVAILIGYWLINAFLIAPDAPAGASPFSKEGNWCVWLDRMLMKGHMYNEVYEPEGIIGHLTGAVTAMLGIFTGEYIREGKASGNRKTLIMLGAAAAMLAAGLLWSLVYPINKALWSSTFVLVVGAYSVALFAIFYWIVDVKGWKKWTPVFTVVGMNSITIYMVQRIVDMRGINRFFFKGLSELLPKPWSAVLLSATFVLVCWLLLYFLYRKKIFLKV